MSSNGKERAPLQREERRLLKQRSHESVGSLASPSGSSGQHAPLSVVAVMGETATPTKTKFPTSTRTRSGAARTGGTAATAIPVRSVILFRRVRKNVKRSNIGRGKRKLQMTYPLFFGLYLRWAEGRRRFIYLVFQVVIYSSCVLSFIIARKRGLVLYGHPRQNVFYGDGREGGGGR